MEGKGVNFRAFDYPNEEYYNDMDIENEQYCNTAQIYDNDDLKDIVLDNRDKEYNWMKVIGQGTFGTVYQAYHFETKQTVAIKKVYQDPKYRNREFSIVIDLNHRNCIKIHNYFFTKEVSQDEEIYLNIVMDFIPNTLYKILRYYGKTNQKFPDMLAKLLSYQMLRSLAYISGISVWHRDIKPQNILIDLKDYRLVLCDFGSAKKMIEDEESVAYIWSRFYRSPELILGGKKYGCEIDVWAAGWVIGEMFLGDPLFWGNNNKEQFLHIVNLLGVPTEADYEAMGYEHKINMPKINPITLEEKLKNKASPQAIDLLKKLLDFNPKSRLEPFQALQHPYFDDLRKNRILVNNRPIVDLFNFGPEEIGNNTNLLTKLVPEWYQQN